MGADDTEKCMRECSKERDIRLEELISSDRKRPKRQHRKPFIVGVRKDEGGGGGVTKVDRTRVLDGWLKSTCNIT